MAARLDLRPLPVGRLGGTRALAIGRVAAGVLVLAAMPGFVSTVADILGSG